MIRSYQTPLIFLILLTCLTFAGCTSDAIRWPASNASSLKQDVSKSTIVSVSPELFGYAFSGKVVQSGTEKVIPLFSVDVVGDDPAILAVLNPLGSADGIFHISRNAGALVQNFRTLPLIVSAPGYHPIVQLVDIGSDCDADQCPRVQPTLFRLIPVETVAPEATPSRFSTRGLGEFLGERGITQWIKELAQRKKISVFTSRQILERPSESTMAVVFLDSWDARVAESPTTMSLLKEVDSKWSQSNNRDWTLAEVLEQISLQRNLASVALSAAPLLSYLESEAELFTRTDATPMGKLIASIVKNRKALPRFAEANTQLAMPSFMTSFAPAILQDTQWASSPVEAAWGQLVRLKEEKVAAPMEELLPAAQLIQVLNTRHGQTVAKSFNKLVIGKGIKAIESFSVKDNDFRVLSPYLSPLGQALKGPLRSQIIDWLSPILKRNDPALALKNLVLQLVQLPVQNQTGVVATLFPTAYSSVKGMVEAKKLFALQTIIGRSNSEFKDLSVRQDLVASSAVVVQATGRDLSKLSTLSNIRRIEVIFQ